MSKTHNTRELRSEQTGHTPEPWSCCVYNDPQYAIGPNPNKLNIVALTSQKNDKANAERIVACVNALAGIQNPAAIKQLVEAARGLLKYGADNDSLLVEKALRAIDSPVPDAQQSPTLPIKPKS